MTSNDKLLDLIDFLRRSGLSVPVGNLMAFLEAVELVGSDLKSIYWCGRATLVHSPREGDLFDHVYRHWILGAEPELVAERSTTSEPLVVDDDSAEEQPESSDHAVDGSPVLRFSRTETLHSMDFAAMSAEEREEVDRLIAAMNVRPSTRRSRRRRPSSGKRGSPDLRRTLRESLRTGGEPLRQRTRVRSDVARRVVIIADISGSMASYSRSLLRFAHAAVTGRANVEAFVLGTRLTRVTRELDTKDPDDALRRATESVEDWSGGTRLGEGLRAFNDQWGTKGMARGSIVVILSDGWDRGDPQLLDQEMGRLSRVAHRVVWVNPLKASDGYAPLARGMAAALPHVDHFIEGHSLDSLEALSQIVSGGQRPLRSTEPVLSTGGEATR